jgi:hypothetical protein
MGCDAVQPGRICGTFWIKVGKFIGLPDYTASHFPEARTSADKACKLQRDWYALRLSVNDVPRRRAPNVDTRDQKIAAGT